MILHETHRMIASFWGGKLDGTKGKHWVKCDDLYFPLDEGGFGFKSLFDSSKDFLAKL